MTLLRKHTLLYSHTQQISDLQTSMLYENTQCFQRAFLFDYSKSGQIASLFQEAVIKKKSLTKIFGVRTIQQQSTILKTMSLFQLVMKQRI